MENYGRTEKFDNRIQKKNMFPSLPENINYIENKLCHSDDIKKLDVPFQNGKGTIIYIESLADPNLIHQLALEPLLTRSDLSLDKAFATLNMKKETNLNYGVQLLLQGKSLYFHEHVDSFCIFETALSLKRDITEPDNEGDCPWTAYWFSRRFSNQFSFYS